jgi:hypothetical protein
MIKFEFFSPNCLTFKFNGLARVQNLNRRKNSKKHSGRPIKKLYKKQFVDEKTSAAAGDNN